MKTKVKCSQCLSCNVNKHRRSHSPAVSLKEISLLDGIVFNILFCNAEINY